MPSCKYRFVRVRISIIMSKTMFGTSRLNLNASQVQMSKYMYQYQYFTSLLTSKLMSGTWRLILTAGQVQIGRSHLGMLSCMSKNRVKTSILMTKPVIRISLQRPPGARHYFFIRITVLTLFTKALAKNKPFSG